LEINKKSRIQYRHFALPEDDPYWSNPQLPDIADCDLLFKIYGIPMAEKAARQAIADWGGSFADITHVVVVTCTNTANPGLDFSVCQRLGLHQNVQRTLLHGIGCAGGVAALRSANEFLLGAAAQDKPGKALVIACELTSMFCRTELADAVRDQQVNIGPTLFGDGAGALVLCNGINTKPPEKAPLWNILNAQSTILGNSANCLEYTVHPFGKLTSLRFPTTRNKTKHLAGYHAVISKDVPEFVRSWLSAGFKNLITSTPSLCCLRDNFNASNYDWALHPGGYGILRVAQRVLSLSEDHLRKSYDVYQTHGNTSSATILSIINELAHEESTAGSARDKVIVCSFGPGMTMEMAVIARAGRLDSM
jgi:type III polyketide synthase